MLLLAFPHVNWNLLSDFSLIYPQLRSQHTYTHTSRLVLHSVISMAAKSQCGYDHILTSSRPVL